MSDQPRREPLPRFIGEELADLRDPFWGPQPGADDPRPARHREHEKCDGYCDYVGCEEGDDWRGAE